MTFEERLTGYQARCEDALKQAVTRYFTPGSAVSAAAEYALMGGGKRVRGVLVQAAGDLLGGGAATRDAWSAAIEMIHAFSLVHDDLPCMDDDDMRRGRPATHIKFGEATALLAGDLLAIQAFEVAAGVGALYGTTAKAVSALAAAAGARGMIFGQELDLKYENEAPDEAALRLTHAKKTGALIRVAVELGMLSAGKSEETEPELAQYAHNIGLVFQIVDDVLDVTANEAQLGKPVGSDAAQGKTTFVTMFGLERAKRQIETLTEGAVGPLQDAYGGNGTAGFLAEYARQLSKRVY